MNRYNDERRCPDFAGRCKFAAAVVVIGLIIAAVESPINWVPTATLHDSSAAEPTPAAAEYFPSGYTLDATDPAPHVEAF